MPLKTETRTIGDIKVTVTQFPAMRSLNIFTKLGKILGPALLNAPTVDLQEAVSLDTASFSKAAETLFSSIDGDSAERLVAEILSSSVAVVDRKQIDLSDVSGINMAFDGRLHLLMMSVKFALEVNYGDFLSELMSSVGSG